MGTWLRFHILHRGRQVITLRTTGFFSVHLCLMKDGSHICRRKDKAKSQKPKANSQKASQRHQGIVIPFGDQGPTVERVFGVGGGEFLVPCGVKPPAVAFHLYGEAFN